MNEHQPSDSVLENAERLCLTLERIGDALVAIDADTLLDTEVTLEQLVATLKLGRAVEDKAALEALVRRAARALVRCRSLGASFSNLADARLRARTGVEAYGRGGEFVRATVAGSAVKVSI